MLEIFEYFIVFFSMEEHFDNILYQYNKSGKNRFFLSVVFEINRPETEKRNKKGENRSDHEK